MFEPAPPLLDQYLSHLSNTIPSGFSIDLTDTIFLTVLMMIMDMALRLIAEAVKCNHALGRRGTIPNILKVLCWTGWRRVNGKQYLMSKRLREATFHKMLKSHILLFVLAPLSYMLPDTVMFGMRIDDTLAHLFMMLPIFYEITSLIENTQAIDVKEIQLIVKLVRMFKGEE